MSGWLLVVMVMCLLVATVGRLVQYLWEQEQAARQRERIRQRANGGDGISWALFLQRERRR